MDNQSLAHSRCNCTYHIVFIPQYPLFRQLYQEILDFRYHPKELITMYSEALRIMDENTVFYMVDELKAQSAK